MSPATSAELFESPTEVNIEGNLIGHVSVKSTFPASMYREQV